MCLCIPAGGYRYMHIYVYQHIHMHIHMHTCIILPCVYVCTSCSVYDKAINEEINNINT